jgi:hypothetical protein
MPRASEFAVLYSQLGERHTVLASDAGSALKTGISASSHLRKSYRYKKQARALFELANNDLRSRHEAREAPAA